MQWQVNSWQKKGVVFEEHDEVPPDDPESRQGLPSFWESLIPIIVVLVLYNVFKVPTAVAMMAATVVIAVLRLKTLGLSQWMDVLENGLYEGIIPAVNLSVMGGIGAVVALTPFYASLIEWFSTSTLNPYILCWGGGTLMAGVVGSSTSALATLVPTIQPILEGYVAQGYSLENMHRLLCLGSISLDSLPHNGSLMANCALLHCKLKGCYFPIFITCTLLPLIAGSLIALPLAIMGM